MGTSLSAAFPISKKHDGKGGYDKDRNGDKNPFEGVGAPIDAR
jgi:hypothetical protein